MIKEIILQDLKLAFSNFSQFFNQIVFFFIAIVLFVISFPADSFSHQELSQIAIIWFCLIFALIISISNFLKDDFFDGTIDQLFILRQSTYEIIIAKITANWLIYSLPLIFSLPIAIIILKINYLFWPHIFIIALIVSLIVNLIACFCASLALLSSKNQSLLILLILPLIIPIIIFANAAFINSNIDSFSNSVFFLFLILLFLSPILVFCSSFVLKIALRS